MYRKPAETRRRFMKRHLTPTGSAGRKRWIAKWKLWRRLGPGSVSRLPNKNVIGGKWVFRIKRNADGSRSVDKYKVRLVAKCFMQVHGAYHFDTFPPVAKPSNFRTTLADAARYDSKVEKSTATDVRQCFAVYLFF